MCGAGKYEEVCRINGRPLNPKRARPPIIIRTFPDWCPFPDVEEPKMSTEEARGLIESVLGTLEAVGISGDKLLKFRDEWFNPVVKNVSE